MNGSSFSPFILDAIKKYKTPGERFVWIQSLTIDEQDRLLQEFKAIMDDTIAFWQVLKDYIETCIQIVAESWSTSNYDELGRITKPAKDVHYGHSVCNGCGHDMPGCWDVVCAICGKTFCYDCAYVDEGRWICNGCGMEDLSKDKI